MDIKGAGKVVKDFLGVAKDYGVEILTGLFSFGIIAEVATDGSIPVFSGVQTVINTTVTTVTGFFTTINESMALVLTLLTLVVVNFLFGKKGVLRNKGKKKGGMY